MKRLFALPLLFILSASASAASDPAIAVLSHINERIARATLSSSGELTVVEATHPPTMPRRESKQISAQNVSDLGRLAGSLAEAQVQTKRVVTCRTVAKPEAAVSLEVTDSSGDSKLVLSSEKCWEAKVTRPVDANELSKARELRRAILVLVNETVDWND